MLISTVHVICVLLKPEKYPFRVTFEPVGHRPSAFLPTRYVIFSTALKISVFKMSRVVCRVNQPPQAGYGIDPISTRPRPSFSYKIYMARVISEQCSDHCTEWIMFVPKGLFRTKKPEHVRYRNRTDKKSHKTRYIRISSSDLWVLHPYNQILSWFDQQGQTFFYRWLKTIVIVCLRDHSRKQVAADLSLNDTGRTSPVFADRPACSGSTATGTKAGKASADTMTMVSEGKTCSPPDAPDAANPNADALPDSAAARYPPMHAPG